MRRNQRSDAAAAWRRWYKLAVWRRIREQQLAAFPLCARHEKLGMLVAADTVNHVTPHKGDWSLFISGPFESLCTACHSGPVQSHERAPHPTGCDAAGRPLDATHPWNRGGSKT